jgi:DNA-binding transcriptional MerR regulator
MAYKISELSKITGINPETIRYYEKIGAIDKAVRHENGYRHFSKTAVEQLEFIKTCRSLGFNMDEIKSLNQLKQNPNQSCAVADKLASDHLQQVEEKIAQLQQIKTLLQSMGNCQQDSVDSCKVIHSLQTSPNLS